MKKYNDFLNEKLSLNDIKKLENDLVDEFNGLPGIKDIQVSNQKIATYIFIYFEEDYIEELPIEVKSKVDKLLKNRPLGLLQIKASLGYSGGNSLSFTLPGSIVSTYKILYHICSGKNAQSIKDKGLLASSISDITNKFKPQLGEGSFRITTYKANFAVYLKQQLKQVQKFFKYDDPHVVAFYAKDYTFYIDPFFSQIASSSCLTFSDIPSSDIVSIEPLV